MKKRITIFCILMPIFVSLFTSTFAQTNWTKDSKNPVMSGGGEGAWNKHVMMPSILYNSDSSLYEMWYCASIGLPDWRPFFIGFATSPDGITWTQIDTAVLKPSDGTWDEYTVESPMVLYDNGQYKMWYISWSPDTPDKIGHATSPDGITWTKYDNNPIMSPRLANWERGGTSYCSVMPVQGGGYKMWYTGYDVNFTESNIGFATSSDGITWQKDDQNNPVLSHGIAGEWDDTGIHASNVKFINGMYYMWYTGFSDEIHRNIGLATSKDGIYWTKYDDPKTTSPLYDSSDPVLTTGPDEWENRGLEAACVILEGDSLRMWYAGSGEPVSSHTWKIGRASSGLHNRIIHVPGDVNSIQAGIDLAIDGDTVLVQPGTYIENIDFKGKNVIVGGLTLTTGENSYIRQTIIDGDSSGSVVEFLENEDSTAILCGFTLINGTGTIIGRTDGGNIYAGGGIFIDGAQPKLKDLIITGNNSTFGGGIFCGLGVNIRNLTMTENSAGGSGGGIYFGERYRGPGWKRSLLSQDSIHRTEFDSINRCNIYQNKALFAGNDLYSTFDETTIEVYLDTFTVLIPDSTHAFPLSNFSFDILNEAVTNIDLVQKVPKEYKLKQNYPNPFNPSTTIEFTLLKSEFVELKVYNILGKEVATLVSKKLNQGNHTYTFDGKNLASGVYYYRIKAGNFVQTRKMIYLK